jgi:hypothetical protein
MIDLDANSGPEESTVQVDRIFNLYDSAQARFANCEAQVGAPLTGRLGCYQTGII